jgi:ketosteroid isomerase-like protein
MARMPFRRRASGGVKTTKYTAGLWKAYVNGDEFVVRFTMDVTPKATGKRMKMDEVGVYTVKNGKIVAERFCYLQA